MSVFAKAEDYASRSTGVLELQLCEPRPGAFDGVRVNQLDDPSPPAFAGSVEAFIAHHTAAGVPAEVLRRQLLNAVKKCPACGKPNAYTLDTCNGCGEDLSAVALGHTNNVFTGFVFGIAKGPFPFTISLRAQTERHLVFDDLLALGPCHLNVIPTDAYLPDIRVLFARPRAGLALVERLFGAVWDVARAQFLAHAAYRAKIMGPAAQGLGDDAVRAHAIAGFNFPPSQYQLHLQFILPPCTPFHWSLFQRGVHCTPRRFFPYEYVRDALAALNRAGARIEGAGDMPIGAIVDTITRDHGVNYDVVHRACVARYKASIRAFCNWDPDDFEGLLLDPGCTGADAKPAALLRPWGRPEGGLIASRASVMAGVVKGWPEAKSAKAVQASDKLALQNYGRPYSAEGKPTGTHYKHAKAPPLPEWAAAADDDHDGDETMVATMTD